MTKKTMSAPEYRAALKRLGLDQSAAGEFFGVHGVTGRRWALSGPPAPVDKFLKVMVTLHWTPDYVERVVRDYTP